MKVFRRRRHGVAGIDIGADCVRLLQLEAQGSRWRVVHHASEPLPAGAMADGIPVDGVVVAAAIERAFDRAGCRTRRVVAAMPQERVAMRVVDLPGGLSDAELADQIEVSLPDILPGVAGPLQVDFAVLHPSRERQDCDAVLVIVARSSDVEAGTRMLEDAGLDVVIMDIGAHAVMRGSTLYRGGIGTSQAAVLMLGQEQSVLFGMDDEGVVRVRDGLPGTGPASALTDERRQAALALADGVLQCRHHGELGSSTTGVMSLILAGDMSDDPELPDVLAQAAGLDCHRAMPDFTRLDPGPWHDAIAADGPGLLAVTGLAMRGAAT